MIRVGCTYHDNGAPDGDQRQMKWTVSLSALRRRRPPRHGAQSRRAPRRNSIPSVTVNAATRYATRRDRRVTRQTHDATVTRRGNRVTRQLHDATVTERGSHATRQTRHVTIARRGRNATRQSHDATVTRRATSRHATVTRRGSRTTRPEY